MSCPFRLPQQYIEEGSVAEVLEQDAVSDWWECRDHQLPRSRHGTEPNVPRRSADELCEAIMDPSSAAENLENCGAQHPPDRRQSPRLRCQLPVEIRTQGSRFANRAETTDVSLTGCYVATMQPMPLGTELDLRCWVGARPIDCRAVVRTCDPCVGNGIQFLDLDDLAKSILGYYLSRLQAEDETVNAPTGVIRTRP
jgi:hypothetical protein